MWTWEYEDMVSWNIDIDLKVKNGTSMISLFFNSLIQDTEIITFELNAQSEREEKNVEIESPENFKNIDELGE